MRYRLGLDLGANSIGWCCLALDDLGAPSGLLDIGVRVYPDGRNPKDGSSLAAARRLPRSMRRNRDRYLRRRRNLLNALSRFGLMPAGESERRAIAQLNPYALRAQALMRKLAPYEMGRVLFHLNQHRGFKSNRKVDRAGDNEGGLIRDAARDLQAELLRHGHRTLGQYLASRHARRDGVRVRLAGSGKTSAYPFYPLREMVKAEFDAVWAEQAPALGLTDEARSEIHRIIFHQRPLRPPRLGKCWLEPGEDRAYRAMPSVQAFRIAQDLAHLRVQLPGEPERPLTDAERQMLEGKLLAGKTLDLDKVRKDLKLPSEADFNLGALRKDELVGAETAHRLGSRTLLGKTWHDLSLDVQDAAVALLLEAESDEEASAFLQSLGFGVAESRAAARVGLVEGTAALSLKAIGRILPHLRAGMTYSDAVQAAGYRHHSDRRTGEVRDRLPYYGELLFERLGTGSGVEADAPEKRWGRAPNPTVHVALNELRRVVNTIVARHGAPTQIVIETLRELGRSAVQRREYEREQRRNQDANDRRRQMLREFGVAVNGDNLMRLRLWEEQAGDPLKRICPYTGTLITARMALSAEVEEDHILPFALTLDDSSANRVLVTRAANRQKARRTPFEAFGHTDTWASILANIEALPSNKRWRFAPDALEKAAAGEDFLARHLTDSSTISRYARLYLDVLTPGNVWSTPGRLTGLLRAKLGITTEAILGRGGRVKSRTDHRHHAIDSIVIALTDRSLLQRVGAAARRGDKAGRLFDDLPEPWPGFHEQIKAAVLAIVVSHKPDTGWQGALHNDTAYGPIAGAGKKQPNVVVRRPVETFADWSPKDIANGVRDAALASRIAATVATTAGGERKAALLSLKNSGQAPLRRVRTVERLDNVATIRDRRTALPYKMVKLDSNHRIELWRMPEGKFALVAVSTLDAARSAISGAGNALSPRPHPAAKLLMRLHKNDMVALGHGHERQVLRVVKMRNGEVTLAAHNEAGNLKARDADKSDAFKYLSASATRLVAGQARKVWVDPAGRLRDPGVSR